MHFFSSECPELQLWLASGAGAVGQRTQHICVLLVSSLIFLHQIWCSSEATPLITSHLISPHLSTPQHVIPAASPPSQHPPALHPRCITPTSAPPIPLLPCLCTVAASSETPCGDASGTRRGNSLFCSFISSAYVSFMTLVTWKRPFSPGREQSPRN